jgi:PGF-pre-PGF domain-containing protein
VFAAWTDVAANKDVEWLISATNIPVTKLVFAVNQSISNLMMDLTSFSGSSLPSGVNISAPNNIYTYIKISTPDYQSVTHAKVYFSIPSSWFSTNNYDKDRVKAYRFVNGDWLTLYTNIISTSGSVYNYEFDTTGFSFFALTAPNAPPIILPKTNETITNVTSNGTTIVTTKFNITCGDSICNKSINETCSTCEKDCVVCQISETTAIDQIYGFISLYYIHMSVVIIAAAIAFSLFYIFEVKGGVLPPIKLEIPTGKQIQGIFRTRGKKEEPESQQSPSKGLPFLKKKEERKDLRKKPEAFKLE